MLIICIIYHVCSLSLLLPFLFTIIHLSPLKVLHIFFAWLCHLYFVLWKCKKFPRSVLLVQLIIFSYALSSFIYGHLLFKNFRPNFSFSHISKLCVTSLHTGHHHLSAPVLSFLFPNPSLNYSVSFLSCYNSYIVLSPTVSSYPSFQIQIFPLTLSIIICLCMSLHLVLKRHIAFTSLPYLFFCQNTILWCLVQIPQSSDMALNVRRYQVFLNSAVRKFHAQWCEPLQK